MKNVLFGLPIVWFILCAPAGTYPKPAPPAYVVAALADPARPAEQVSLDRWRKPAELIAYAGVKPGDRIADFMSGNAYLTRILSRIVGATGRVYAFIPTQQLANCSPDETVGTKMLERDGRYRNVTVITAAAGDFSTPESLDMVWTVQNYHDLHDRFMAPTDIRTVNAAIFRALKPGGILLIVDHVAAPGSLLRDTETLHRIDPQSISSEVTAAGFAFESQSDVLRNAQDPHLLPVFDSTIRHKTDQIVLKFRKPSIESKAERQDPRLFTP